MQACNGNVAVLAQLQSIGADVNITLSGTKSVSLSPFFLASFSLFCRSETFFTHVDICLVSVERQSASQETEKQKRKEKKGVETSLISPFLDPNLDTLASGRWAWSRSLRASARAEP